MSTENANADARTDTETTTPRCDDCSAFVAADATTCGNCDADLTADDDALDLPAHAFDWLANDDVTARRADERTLAEIAATPRVEWHNTDALSWTAKQLAVLRYAATNPYATLELFEADDAPASPQYARDVLHRTFDSTYATDREIFN